MYLRHYDNRFGDTYEIYINDQSGNFEGALRSLEGIGRSSIFYDNMSEIPPVQRNAIEHLIQLAWEQKTKS